MRYRRGPNGSNDNSLYYLDIGDTVEVITVVGEYHRKNGVSQVSDISNGIVYLDCGRRFNQATGQEMASVLNTDMTISRKLKLYLKVPFPRSYTKAIAIGRIIEQIQFLQMKLEDTTLTNEVTFDFEEVSFMIENLDTIRQNVNRSVIFESEK